jgi:peroxiredoxin
VDTPETTQELRAKAGYTYTFLSDRNAEVIRRYDILHRGAGPHGQDIARPAEYLLDASGTIRWLNVTEDYRVRARHEQIIEQAKALQ